MRRLKFGWVVCFLLTYSAFARAVTCTAATAARALEVLAGKSDEERVAALSGALDACENRFELLKSVVDRGRLVRESKQAVPHQPGTIGPDANKPAPGGNEAHPAPPTFDARDLAAILGALRIHLSREMERLEADCEGFRECPPEKLKPFVRNLEWYLHKLGDAQTPRESVREAGPLLATLGRSSPEVALAQVIIESLQRLDGASLERLAERHETIRNVLAASTTARKLRILLEHPDRLKQVDETIAAIGPTRIVAAGRSVNVALDLHELQASPQCGAGLRAALEAALLEERPLGVKVYDEQTPEFGVSLTRHVRVKATTHCEDRAEPCLHVEVAGWLGKTEHSGPPDAFPSVNAPLKGCALVGKTMTDLAREIFGKFAIDLRAGDASLEAARLVTPSCVSLTVEKLPAEKWNEPTARLTLRRALLSVANPDARTDWPGFGQELVSALEQHSSILPPTLAGPRASGTPAGAMTLAWAVLDRGELPPRSARTIALKLEGNGLASGLRANLLFELRDEPECASRLAMQQTVAEHTAVWLATEYLSTPDDLKSSLNRPIARPPEGGKNWPLSFLGLVFAGLPQLVDDDPDNDTRGVILAAADAALLTSTVVLALVSVEQRQRFSNGDEGSLAAANGYLLASRVTLLGLAVPRVISVAW